VLRVVEQYAVSDTGRQRRINEDSLLARSPLFVVADGMGGAQAGEVASRIAIEAFQDGDLVAEGLVDGGLEQRLAAQATAANTRIHELSQVDADHAGMGTTLTAIYVGELEVAIAHVGDSRAYCWRDGELLRLTDDHSLVDELIRQGRLTPEEAAEHPQRSIITRALGPEEDVEVDTRSFRARSGDVYLLCSDGLTTMVDESTLALLLGEHVRLAEAGEALVAQANEAGGRDNITVILLRVEEVSAGNGSAPVSAADSAATAATATTAATAAGSTAATTAAATTTAPPPPATTADSARTAAAASANSHPAADPGSGRRTAVARRIPRTSKAPRQPATRARKRWRRLGASMVVLALLAVLLGGAYMAEQSVYFIATNSRGLVTLYEGVPYELPGGIKLYSSQFVSGVSAAQLSAARRHTLLDHTLRSQSDAEALLRSLELGELSER
jgi:PPM family protein phosphatase